MMTFWLYLEGVLKKLFKLFVIASVSKRRLYIDLSVGQKAGTQLPICGQSKTSAGIAEVPADGTDEPDRSLSTGNLEVS